MNAKENPAAFVLLLMEVKPKELWKGQWKW